MKNTGVKLAVLSLMLLGLPPVGILISGRSLWPYLEFPPQTRFIRQAPFSWPLFGGYAVLITGVVACLLLPLLRQQRAARPQKATRRPFPWWGWMSLLAWIVFWGLAWTRLGFLKPFQPHTFAPLWISFILLLNALTFRRMGRCLLTHRTRLFLILFPVSACFWWFFEYLNRFVQNWYYGGVEFRPAAYFLYATISFSTVLPAVASMHALLNSHSDYHRRYRHWIKLHVNATRLLAWSVLVLAGLGLACVGVWPDYLFPLLWIAPLSIVVALQTILGERHVLSGIGQGDWSHIVSFALAALVCGLFWEMWNYYSLAKWHYSIPFVHRFQIFEMPVLGYAGYLPFGLACAVVIMTVQERLEKKRLRTARARGLC